MTLLKRRKKTISTVYIIYSVQTQKRIIASHIKIKTKMKVKNLLLAGLAVAAMTACSNENDEFVNNGNQTGEKNATMEFGITFPSLTRATEDGLATEQDFKTATVIVDYADENLANTVTVIPRELFSPREGTSTLYTKENIAVNEGEAKVYVVLNSIDKFNLTGDNWLKSIYNNQYITGNMDITAITGDNNFLMSGSQEGTVTFAKNEAKTVRVPVDRVAAKLEEKTGSTENNHTILRSYDGKVLASATAEADLVVTLSLERYSYANLQQSSYLFPQSPVLDESLFQPYDTQVNYDYKTIGDLVDGHGDITYCLEHLNSSANPTMALYEAQALINGEKQTFWVDQDVDKDGNNILYTTVGEVQSKYPTFTGTESIAQCKQLGLRKYEEGKCYYTAEIKSDGASKIERNNVYKLTVTDVKKLGLPEPKKEGEYATLTLEVEVKQWTIQTNNFTFE